MLTAAQCQIYVAEFNSLKRQAGASEERINLLNNIVRSLKRLENQVDRLAELRREEAKQDQLRYPV